MILRDKTSTKNKFVAFHVKRAHPSMGRSLWKLRSSLAMASRERSTGAKREAGEVVESDVWKLSVCVTLLALLGMATQIRLPGRAERMEMAFGDDGGALGEGEDKPAASAPETEAVT